MNNFIVLNVIKTLVRETQNLVFQVGQMRSLRDLRSLINDKKTI